MMEEQSPSKQMMKTGEKIAFYMRAGMWAGGIEAERYRANNNYRKMHRLPMYHRNKSIWTITDHSLIKQYEAEHTEEMIWIDR